MPVRGLVIPDLMRDSASPNYREIAAQLRLSDGKPARMPSGMRFVFLCFTNRCGSAYLGDLLRSTGYFGNAKESLNAGEVLAECRKHNMGTFTEYFEHISARDEHVGLYIVKVAPEQIMLLAKSGVLGPILGCSTFLFLTRTNILDQAISRAIAEQSNRWAWDSPSNFPDENLVYSSDRIAEHIQYVAAGNQCFAMFFAINSIEPICLEYERLVEDPQTEISRIARKLGLPSLRMVAERLRYRRQAGEINRLWKARFMGEAKAPTGSSFATCPPIGPIPEEPYISIAVSAHIRNIGDTEGTGGWWVGKPHVGLWIEGFSITPRRGLRPSDIEYQSVSLPDALAPWTPGGTFTGTRGQSLPLRGLRVRLVDAALTRYQCALFGHFAGDQTVGPVGSGEICRSPDWAPLEAFKVVISDREG